MILRWLAYLIPSILIELMCYLLAPVVALFIHSEERTDRVKRLGNATVTMQRDYLIKPLMWFQTHDNAVDEWWYGLFNDTSYFRFLREATQLDYNTSTWIRYCCRVHWLWRNCGYGFLYNLLGRDLEVPKQKSTTVRVYGIKNQGLWYEYTRRLYCFQLEAQIPLYGLRHLSINIGWKEHDGFPRALYANRIIGFRKYKLAPLKAALL